MDKAFTFVMFTYNQEKYVIQQLESIKYQINKFAKGFACYFLLCDDASKDKTVELITRWIGQHNDLFVDTKFVVQSQNVGIVNNFLSALQNVATKKFKILAGDDIYFYNNIFDVINKGNYVITPILTFNDDLNVIPSDRLFYNMLLYKQCLKEDVKTFIYDYLKYLNIISAPGVFFEADGMDCGLRNALKEYKFIEDLPLWIYLLAKEETNVIIYGQPIVMYRCDVGVSTNKAHSSNVEYEKDSQKLNEKIFINRHMYPKFLNPYKWKNSVYKMLSRKFYVKNDYVKKVNDTIARDEKSAQEYLDYIFKNASDWMSKNG